MKKLIVSSVLSLALTGCPEFTMDPLKDRVYIKNNSPHSIDTYFAYGGNGGTAYPDTTLPINDYTVKDIKSGTQYPFDVNSLESTINRLPADTLSIYIFHTDTLKKYSWQEVRDGYKVLKRYDLSLEDLKRMNYTITYP